jgi:nascent polypeptide-associated complex subunit alpha
MISQAMSRLGIKQEEIDAKQVIIKLADKEIVINNPKVQKLNMSGHENFQITGDISERASEVKVEISKDDIKTVCEQTGVDEGAAEAALKNNGGDIAAAILELQS